jgi:hypothetical protein
MRALRVFKRARHGLETAVASVRKVRATADPGLFDDLVDEPRPHDCARDGHAWIRTVTTWPGETIERLTWTCTTCGHVRGRA